ncbi:sigma-70 family RNA polymerase sigma factor [Paenibacillus sp. TRM 82003]|nr:sigma-70 family RNA polymerase sigma factor [Paenibacillus sp. TRM 82003]
METTVREAQSGSRDAFVRLIRDNERLLYKVAAGVLRSDHDAADAIQDTILSAYKHLPQLREPRYFRAWLVRLLINHCKRIAQHNRRVVPLKEPMDASAPAADQDTRMMLEEAMDALDWDHKEVIAMFYVDDTPVKEIARLLGVPMGTVKSRLYRAREKLAGMIGNAEERRGTI